MEPTEGHVVKEPRSRSIVISPTEDYVVKEPRSRSIVMEPYRRSCCERTKVKKYRHGVLQKILL